MAPGDSKSLEPAALPVWCSFCGTMNRPDAETCKLCGGALQELEPEDSGADTYTPSQVPPPSQTFEQELNASSFRLAGGDLIAALARIEGALSRLPTQERLLEVADTLSRKLTAENHSMRKVQAVENALSLLGADDATAAVAYLEFALGEIGNDAGLLALLEVIRTRRDFAKAERAPAMSAEPFPNPSAELPANADSLSSPANTLRETTSSEISHSYEANEAATIDLNELNQLAGAETMVSSEAYEPAGEEPEGAATDDEALYEPEVTPDLPVTAHPEAGVEPRPKATPEIVIRKPVGASSLFVPAKPKSWSRIIGVGISAVLLLAVIFGYKAVRQRHAHMPAAAAGRAISPKPAPSEVKTTATFSAPSPGLPASTSLLTKAGASNGDIPPKPAPDQIPLKSDVSSRELDNFRALEQKYEPVAIDLAIYYQRQICALDNGVAEAQKLADLVSRKQEAEARRVKFLFISVSAGEFDMGCSPEDGECSAAENPRHHVQIAKGFEIGQYPVTQATWESVMSGNPSHFRGPDRPVEEVAWGDVQEFLRRLNARADGYRYRLPTEAEWEYAARAGSGFNRYGAPEAIAWFEENSGLQTHAVGQKQPNAWGLYDTLGNVWQWVEDWFGPEYYQSSPGVNPKGPASGEFRVVRGSPWNYHAKSVRLSFRYRWPADHRGADVGFRCVREKVAAK